jgi:lactonase
MEGNMKKITHRASASKSSSKKSFTPSVTPLTADIESLYTIVAEPWIKISDDTKYFLEGPCFGPDGTFYCTNPKAGHAYIISPKGKVKQIWDDFKLRPIVFAFHKNGRLFYTAETATGIGTLCHSAPDLTGIVEVKPRYEGKPTFFNDCDFNPDGVLYVTDSTGQRNNPTGGVYAFSPDMQTITPIVKNVVGANGITLAPPGTAFMGSTREDIKTKSGYFIKAGTPVESLWIGEAGTSTIINVQFVYSPDGPVFSHIAGYNEPYHVSGMYPTDGMKCDVNGNVYICVIMQGYILILNKNGVPIAKVVIPGRDKGVGFMNSNMTFKPGTDEGYCVAAGGTGPAVIYRFQALAKGRKFYWEP